MIVKVQREAQAGGHAERLLIYNHDRSVGGIFPMSQEIRKTMGARRVAHFRARMDGTLIVLLSEVLRDW